MKKIFYVGLAAAMISFTSCGGSDKSNTSAVDSTETAANSTLGVVSIAEPAITHALKDYIQVVKVTPVGLVCEEDEIGNKHVYAKGAITVKCIKEDSTNNYAHYKEGLVTLLDANGMSLYDDHRYAGDQGINTYGMTLDQEKTIHYRIKIFDDTYGRMDRGVITDQETLDKYLGPVKFVQITE